MQKKTLAIEIIDEMKMKDVLSIDLKVINAINTYSYKKIVVILPAKQNVFYLRLLPSLKLLLK